MMQFTVMWGKVNVSTFCCEIFCFKNDQKHYTASSGMVNIVVFAKKVRIIFFVMNKVPRETLFTSLSNLTFKKGGKPDPRVRFSRDTKSGS